MSAARLARNQQRQYPPTTHPFHGHCFYDAVEQRFTRSDETSTSSAERYIVDFCTRRARLVVEVDGECHAERRRADAWRGRALRALGYRVLRISAQLLMQDLLTAVALVRAAL